MSHPDPDIQCCLQIMEDFSMWENIRRHSFMVARVADFVLSELHNVKDTSHELPKRSRVIAGALLHDIGKTKCIQDGCSHAPVGAEFCRDLGYPEIADIVANHVILSNFEEERYIQGHFNATELVFYADKRVCHDEVVDLDARLEYILGKYANGDKKREEFIHKNFSQVRKIEQHLFSKLDITPDTIKASIKPYPEDLRHYLPEEETS